MKVGQASKGIKQIAMIKRMMWLANLRGDLPINFKFGLEGIGKGPHRISLEVMLVKVALIKGVRQVDPGPVEADGQVSGGGGEANRTDLLVTTFSWTGEPLPSGLFKVSLCRIFRAD